MAKLFLVALALTCAVALVLGQDAAADQKKAPIKEDQFLLDVWRGKQDCAGVPTLPISLINDPSKCQVVLKNFIWAKGSCQGIKLTGQVCTDAQCQNCQAIPDVAPENTCQKADFIGGSFKYTCSATKKNVTEAKQAPQPSQQLNQTLGQKAKEKIQEKSGSDQQASTQEVKSDAQSNSTQRETTRHHKSHHKRKSHRESKLDQQKLNNDNVNQGRI